MEDIKPHRLAKKSSTSRIYLNVPSVLFCIGATHAIASHQLQSRSVLL